MKITCQSCGKRYDTDIDELCPKCGSYNPINRETADPNGSYAEKKAIRIMENIGGNRSSRNRKNRKIRKTDLLETKIQTSTANVPSLEKQRKGRMSGIYFQQICYFLCCPDASTAGM